MGYAGCDELKVVAVRNGFLFWIHVERYIEYYIYEVAQIVESIFDRNPEKRSLKNRLKMLSAAISILSSLPRTLANDLNASEEDIQATLAWIVLEVMDSMPRDMADTIEEIRKRCLAQ